MCLLNISELFLISGGLGYMTLYFLDIAMCEFDDALVVLGVLIHQASALKDFHRLQG